jgi:hypothetical protein
MPRRNHHKSAKPAANVLDRYAVIYINRPNTPHIDRFIDREFEVIYVNVAAQPGAKVVWLR